MNASSSLTRLCEAYDILILYLFGSQAKAAVHFLLNGEPIPPTSSDLDVGILPARRLSVREKVAFAQALEELFRVKRVDLVVIPEADPFLAANIVRGERVYARDSYLADEYDLYILRRAGDLAPLERERMQIILTKTL